MPGPFDELERLARTERRATLATLVAMHGTSPRREGARMWVGEDGAILGSVTIGGCVDVEVVRASERVLADSSPELISVELGDQDAHALGLTCAGTVDVLVRPVSLGSTDDPLLEAWRTADAHTGSGGRAVICTLVPGPGAAAGTTNGIMTVLDDGAVHGSLGHAGLDEAATVAAADHLRRGVSGVDSLEVDGAPVEVYFEVHGRGPLLVIVGGGAIAEPLSAMAGMLGMHIVIVEGRERFAQADRFPAAQEVMVGMPSEIVASMHYDGSSAIVVIAHDYKFDVPVLENALRTDAGYIGMLGSRRRCATILGMLAERGADPAAISRIRAPIGLDTGGQTAAEIALSILAEINAVRNGRSGGPMRDRVRSSGRNPETPLPATPGA